MVENIIYLLPYVPESDVINIVCEMVFIKMCWYSYLENTDELKIIRCSCESGGALVTVVLLIGGIGESPAQHSKLSYGQILPLHTLNLLTWWWYKSLNKKIYSFPMKYCIAKPKLSVIGCSRYWCFTPEVSPDNFVFCIFDIELIKSIYEYFFIPLSNFAILVFYTWG